MITKQRTFVLLAFLAALAAFLFWGLPPEKPDPTLAKPVVHELLGLEETCIDCHGIPEGFSPAHAIEAIGCSPCHLGDPTASDLAEAHRNMVLVPGNLADMYQTCGAANCHHDIADRVDHSLMATMSGVISVDKFVFGEIDAPEGAFHIKDLGHSAADTHLRHLCASCHLGNEKTHPGPINELSRGGGCNACHLNYSTAALESLELPGETHNYHPALSVAVKDDHCFGCHSRSSRISLNYAGWHETQLSADEIDPTDPGYRVLMDERVVEYVQEDIHHQAGLSCIDCHHALEVMGDGQTYEHKEEALLVHCADCHRKKYDQTLAYGDLDLESKKILNLRQVDASSKAFLMTDSEVALINAWVNELGEPELQSKISGQTYALGAPSEVCLLEGGHGRLSCESCHTSWAPSCIGCHNAYEPDAEAFDLLDNKIVQGQWVEYIGEFFHDAPTLGIVQPSPVEAPEIEQIKTFVSGMVLSIDPSAFDNEEVASFHRLYAPTAAHTIQPIGRSCQSCHNNPLAIGYGRGDLDFDPNRGRWTFTPEYAASPEDGLPQDAWIGFLEETEGPRSTRTYTRPFNVEEQIRILTVGACLTCHKDTEQLMQDAILDFKQIYQRRSAACVVPVF
jgi:hypothetical protein